MKLIAKDPSDGVNINLPECHWLGRITYIGEIHIEPVDGGSDG